MNNGFEQPKMAETVKNKKVLTNKWPATLLFLMKEAEEREAMQLPPASRVVMKRDTVCRTYGI